MPKGHVRTSCKQCERTRAECGSFSKRGLCADCCNANMAANMADIVTQSGPYYDHWIRRTILAARVKLVASERRAG